RAGFKRMLHPRSVQVITLNGKPVEDGILQGLWVYLSAYAVIFVISTMIISLDGFSILTNLSATLSCLGNIGPGLDTVGPAGNFASFSWFSKIVLSLDMLFGRLEIFPLIALFSHDVYRRRNINIRRAL
ncbi:MAG: TrkH family potassium uptake protein, partial [Eubacteriales bacterium]|nr:TrkH family potassium uptake protein [Eubacteriales bacterium]